MAISLENVKKIGAASDQRRAREQFDLSGAGYGNKSAERIYGWTSSEIIGRNIRETIYKNISGQYDEAKGRLLETGEFIGEMNQATKDGGEIIAESRWTLVRDDKGEPKSALVINTDVTEKKKNGGSISARAANGEHRHARRRHSSRLQQSALADNNGDSAASDEIHR